MDVVKKRSFVAHAPVQLSESNLVSIILVPHALKHTHPTFFFSQFIHTIYISYWFPLRIVLFFVRVFYRTSNAATECNEEIIYMNNNNNGYYRLL